MFTHRHLAINHDKTQASVVQMEELSLGKKYSARTAFTNSLARTTMSEDEN